MSIIDHDGIHLCRLLFGFEPNVCPSMFPKTVAVYDTGCISGARCPWKSGHRILMHVLHQILLILWILYVPFVELSTTNFDEFVRGENDVPLC
mmetsp:Transcript_31293/g.47988  ORF Transcript_31293/g.47988 Transcript_31293/m.47988 type:complete len:93 (+) Transcript_31293:303-581(+)